MTFRSWLSASWRMSLWRDFSIASDSAFLFFGLLRTMLLWRTFLNYWVMHQSKPARTPAIPFSFRSYFWNTRKENCRCLEAIERVCQLCGGTAKSKQGDFLQWRLSFSLFPCFASRFLQVCCQKHYRHLNRKGKSESFQNHRRPDWHCEVCETMAGASGVWHAVPTLKVLLPMVLQKEWG